MSFLKDHQILDIKMTPEGKEKFAKGEFNPTSFSLGDSDVIYSHDSFSNISENSTKVHDRVKEVPRLSTQTHYGEKRINKNTSVLGTSQQDGQKSPYFKLTSEKAEMSTINYSQSNVAFQENNVPQVELRDILNFLRSEKTDSGITLQIFGNEELPQDSFEDSTLDGFVFYIESEGFTINLEEINGSSEFDLHLFEVTKDEDNHEVLKEIEFEEENGIFFSDLFNIQTDVAKTPMAEQREVSLRELYDLKEIDDC